MRLKVLKYPSVGKWYNGTLIIDTSIDMCDENTKSKKRKGDIISDIMQKMWAKSGNVTLTCPLKKVCIFTCH